MLDSLRSRLSVGIRLEKELARAREQRQRDKPLRAQLRDQERALARIESTLDRLTKDVARRDQVSLLDEGIVAVLRTLHLGDVELESPFDLTAQRFRALSQNEEDGLTLALLKRVGAGQAQFVEVGAGTNGGNSGFLARELGWRGTMLEADSGNVEALSRRFNSTRVKLIESWVTRENINELLSTAGVPQEPDFLSIDIDGNDYWVLEALSTIPRILVVEFNSLFGPDRSVAVPYEPAFDRSETDKRYYGASLRALERLGSRKGYRLVAVEPRGVNAFFLRDGVGRDIPRRSAPEVFTLIQGHRHSAEVESFSRHLEDAKLPLVEISG